MTATSASPKADALPGRGSDPRPAVPPPPRGLARVRWALADAAMMCKRSLIALPRIPELLIFATIQPVMFVLLFRYVFGGAINTGGTAYVNFLMPGIFVQTVAFGSIASGIGLADDLQKGIIDRLRSLPMARSAVLVGRTLSDLVRNLFTVAIMIAVGVAVGFRFGGGAGQILAGLGLLVLFSFAFSWIAATVGLMVRSVEAAQSGGFIWLFPLTFASSAFVPLTSMPGWLQTFASHTPVTYTVNALRALLLGKPVSDDGWLSLVCSLGILAIFVPLSVSRYRRTTGR